MAVLVDDVLALIDALDLDRPMLCGFSEGGVVASIVGIRKPDSVRAIVNDAGFDLFNPEAPAYGMSRMMLGGRPDATEADPDAAAAFFQEIGMGDLLAKLQADYDDMQGDGY